MAVAERASGVTAGVVLDTSAILAVARGERGGDIVVEHIFNSLTCAVNLTEVVSRLLDFGAPPDEVGQQLSRLTAQIVPFDRDLALQAGLLRAATRHKGLSLGDRACLALAMREGLPVLTADTAWSDLDLGVEVVLIR